MRSVPRKFSLWSERENVVYSRLVSLIFCLFPFVSSRASAHQDIRRLAFRPARDDSVLLVFRQLSRPFAICACVHACVRAETNQPAVCAFFSIIANMTKSAKIISIERRSRISVQTLYEFLLSPLHDFCTSVSCVAAFVSFHPYMDI